MTTFRQRKKKHPGDGNTTWTETQSKIFEFSHKWTIHNFSYYAQNEPGEKLTSSVFASKNNDAVKWELLLYPHGVNEDSKTNLTLFLRPKENPGTINAKFSLAIIDASGERTHRAGYTHTYKDCEGYGMDPLIKRVTLVRNKDTLLSGDKLMLMCKGTYTTDPIIFSESSEAILFPVPKSKMHDDFGSLLETHKFSDVILNVCGSEFHAHKAILSARSAVFAAMFDNEMQEQRENRVTITDTDPEVLDELLKFIYTDKTPKLEDVAAKLICVADKYAVLRLKKMCAASLFKSLSVDNALDTLILADLHNAEKLKSTTLDFISLHAQAVMRTESYESMFETQPRLVAEALTMVVVRQKGNGEPGKCQSPQ